MRGTHVASEVAEQDRRFIPACAGNTITQVYSCRMAPVHPRLCGEHHSSDTFGANMTGSSPPVRGTPILGQCLRDQNRFIPACAGNTWMPKTSAPWQPVHPRLCGEHSVKYRHPAVIIGSSPPVRGTLVKAEIGKIARRFIPACAGNTCRTIPTKSAGPVHPRLCGEHLRLEQVAAPAAGSSPPVRGTLVRSLLDVC